MSLDIFVGYTNG